MTGEDEEVQPGARAEPAPLAPPQPGGRPPAPGQLALVQAFINTHYDLEHDHGADVWRTPDGLRAWLQDRDLLDRSATIGEPERARAVEAREALRALAAVGGGHEQSADMHAALHRLNRAATGAAAEVRFDGGCPGYIRAGSGSVSDAVGLVLAITAASMISGEWGRLKVCPGEECGWAFYDASRNGSGRWCSMAVCGGRAKSRAHYRRLRRGGR
jgi:predicted RNA-binding Zn ribbon-like protein